VKKINILVNKLFLSTSEKPVKEVIMLLKRRVVAERAQLESLVQKTGQNDVLFK
jgi:hypothetical protein